MLPATKMLLLDWREGRPVLAHRPGVILLWGDVVGVGREPANQSSNRHRLRRIYLSLIRDIYHTATAAQFPASTSSAPMEAFFATAH